MTHPSNDPHRDEADIEHRAGGPGPRPGADGTGSRPVGDDGLRSARRFFARGPWEMAASILIGVGVVMLMQPFFMWAFTYSFAITLVGTVMFVIVSHFPE